MIVKLLAEHHLEFLYLIRGCRGSSESALVKMANCRKSHAASHFVMVMSFFLCSGNHIHQSMHNFLDHFGGF